MKSSHYFKAVQSPDNLGLSTHLQPCPLAKVVTPTERISDCEASDDGDSLQLCRLRKQEARSEEEDRGHRIGCLWAYRDQGAHVSGAPGWPVRSIALPSWYVLHFLHVRGVFSSLE